MGSGKRRKMLHSLIKLLSMRYFETHSMKCSHLISNQFTVSWNLLNFISNYQFCSDFYLGIWRGKTFVVSFPPLDAFQCDSITIFRLLRARESKGGALAVTGMLESCAEEWKKRKRKSFIGKNVIREEKYFPHEKKNKQNKQT